MSTNRVLQFLRPRPRECPCCVARRQYEEIKAACEAIERQSGHVCEFSIPSVSKLAARLGGQIDDDEIFGDDDDSGVDATPEAGGMAMHDELTCRIYLNVEARRATLDEDLRKYAADELRRICCELEVAAEKIEGSAGGKEGGAR